MIFFRRPYFLPAVGHVLTVQLLDFPQASFKLIKQAGVFEGDCQAVSNALENDNIIVVKSIRLSGLDAYRSRYLGANCQRQCKFGTRQRQVRVFIADDGFLLPFSVPLLQYRQQEQQTACFRPIKRPRHSKDQIGFESSLQPVAEDPADRGWFPGF